ncbi:major facilitator superfamily domain-containing protein [Penicillium riverlandense]|uniref:major facilitator superfamily domain-containing protein n=1 Tax=Penicillium riverlandense TaxID=1903569 RepID=UPI002546838F|nr:major facilitator superfamily domain-containing protein [Penicillium riverlandense]KAJ5807978.1 major facilitator superfamily domain-containing protein [Penicillium riverlandense]
MQNQPKTEATDMIPKEDETKTAPQAGTLTTLIDPEIERRVRRKIDCVVLPLSLSYAGVFGMMEELQLHGTQFSWLGSIFYVGQLVAEFPAMYLMSRLPLAKFVAVIVILWGGICMCLAAATTFPSFMGARFALGLAEGAVSPAFVTLTSIWYKKKEHPLRIGLWISCNGLAQIVGALMMYGLGHQKMAIAQWKAMFIICGALTTFLGILFFFLMPAGPETAWFLNPQERLVATQRMQTETEGGDQTDFSIPQLKEAMTDIRAYLSFLFGVLMTLPAPVIAFASLIIYYLGYSEFDTMLYTSPTGAVQIVFIWVGIFLCYLWPNRRCAITIGLTIVPLTGIILLFVLPLSAGWGMIVASWLASVISNIFSILLSLNASNTRGNTKKSIVNALFFAGYAVGAICGPLLWNTEYAPRYRSGLVLALVSWVVFIPTVSVYWFSCVYENKRRYVVEVDIGEHVADIAGKDLTDKQDKHFRYTL